MSGADHGPTGLESAPGGRPGHHPCHSERPVRLALNPFSRRSFGPSSGTGSARERPSVGTRTKHISDVSYTPAMTGPGRPRTAPQAVESHLSRQRRPSTRSHQSAATTATVDGHDNGDNNGRRERSMVRNADQRRPVLAASHGIASVTPSHGLRTSTATVRDHVPRAGLSPRKGGVRATAPKVLGARGEEKSRCRPARSPHGRRPLEAAFIGSGGHDAGRH